MLPTTMLAILSAAATVTVRAHTSFTTLFVDGVDQGDGTCVRQPADPPTATAPVTDLTSTDLICGRDGLTPVAFTCPARAGATLTFVFRTHPDGSEPGALDPSHKGPCAVYLRQMGGSSGDDDLSGGWFKIWADGYDNRTGQWCTDRLIAANGLLSVALPRRLPPGAYLVRPELLALHEAAPPADNPQFYVGCAQVFVEGSSHKDVAAPLRIPAAYEAAVPGYVRHGDAAVAFDIYAPEFPYPLPGPPVPPAFGGDEEEKKDRGVGDGSGSGSGSGSLTLLAHEQAAAAGVALVPSPGAACLVKNANWCGVEVPAYTTENGCWDASADCFRQEAACYAAAPPSGHANCAVWDRKCVAIQAACGAGDFVGPPNAGQPLPAAEAAVPGPIPAAEEAR